MPKIGQSANQHRTLNGRAFPDPSMVRGIRQWRSIVVTTGLYDHTNTWVASSNEGEVEDDASDARRPRYKSENGNQCGAIRRYHRKSEHTAALQRRLPEVREARTF